MDAYSYTSARFRKRPKKTWYRDMKSMHIINIQKSWALRNVMVGRCMMMIFMLSALGIPWILEQPSSSVMEYHPCFQHLASKFRVFKVSWLISFGICDVHPKPLFGKSNWIRYLYGLDPTVGKVAWQKMGFRTHPIAWSTSCAQWFRSQRDVALLQHGMLDQRSLLAPVW